MPCKKRLCPGTTCVFSRLYRELLWLRQKGRCRALAWRLRNGYVKGSDQDHGSDRDCARNLVLPDSAVVPCSHFSSARR